MTHDLVERLRAITLRFASESPDDAVKRRNETARLAADLIETYMADADAHVCRLDLVRRQEDEIRDIKAENANLRAERDAAFAMSKCECGADEACANLARLRADMAELRKATIEEAAAYHDDLASQHEACEYESSHHELMVKLHQEFAAAIRNLGEQT